MRSELIQVERMLGLLKETKHLQDLNDRDVRECIFTAITAVNMVIFQRKCIPLLPVNLETENQERIGKELDAWMEYQERELQVRKSIVAKVDYDFRVLMQHIKYSTEQTLVEESKTCLNRIREYSENVYKRVLLAYNTFPEYWGRINPDEGILELIEDRMHQLKVHWEDFCWLYKELGDYRSKKVLYGILRCWITFEFDIKNEIRENNFPDYYDYDLISCSRDEVFVDLGAYTGDSATAFIDSYGHYKRIYCYEITPATVDELRENLKNHEQVEIRNAGVGKEKGVMYLDEPDQVDSAHRLNQNSGYEIEVVTLDEDIEEKVTFIKMDIEGAELDAIEGAQRHIREEHPKMAVCTYHNNSHIWEIPRKLKEYNPDYRLYMRHNGEQNAFLISEFVTFAL